MIDGIHLGKQVLVVALGIETSGKKHVLGLWQGATENTTVVKELLEDLVARGLNPEQTLLVRDRRSQSAARGDRAGVRRTGRSAALPDSQAAERERAFAEERPGRYGPENPQRLRDDRLRGGQSGTGKIFRQLERINPSAARSLEEGLEETLTVHRLGVGRLLRQTLASTNPIESCFSIVEKVARNVKRWRAGDHALRWTATGLLEAEKKFRKVKGYRELESLQRKLNPSLTQQEQVA